MAVIISSKLIHDLLLFDWKGVFRPQVGILAQFAKLLLNRPPYRLQYFSRKGKYSKLKDHPIKYSAT